MDAIPMIGRDAKKAIDEALSSSPNPVEYCTQFRESYSIKKGRVQSMIELLELCGRSTREINIHVLERVRKRMISLITQASPEKLQRLYMMTFPYIAVPELRAISFAVLERVERIDEEDLRDLAPPLDGTAEFPLQQEPYTKLPINVKQKIWQTIPDLFREELLAVLKDIGPPPERHSIEELTQFKSEEERKIERTHNNILRQLMKLIQSTSGRIYTELLSHTSDVILELCEDRNKTGTRAYLMSYINLYSDLLLEAEGRVQFASARDYPGLQAAMKAVQTLQKAYNSGNLTSKIHLGLKSLTICCTKGAEGFVQSVILLCSPMASDIIAKLIVDRLRDIAVKRSGNMAGFQDEVLEQLTTLAWSSLQVERVLDTKIPYHMDDREKERLFAYFYVVLGQIAYEDHLWNTQLTNTSDRNPPHEDLDKYLRQGSLQRRIIAAYGLQMYKADDVIAVSRFRQHFDTLARSAEQLLEDREKELGRHLVNAIELE